MSQDTQNTMHPQAEELEFLYQQAELRRASPDGGCAASTAVQAYLAETQNYAPRVQRVADAHEMSMLTQDQAEVLEQHETRRAVGQMRMILESLGEAMADRSVIVDIESHLQNSLHALHAAGTKVLEAAAEDPAIMKRVAEGWARVQSRKNTAE